MPFADLDQILTEIATVMFHQIRRSDWVEARYVALIPPDLGMIKAQLLVKRQDGSEAVGASLLGEENHTRVTDLMLEHRKVTEKLGQPWWYKFDMTVDHAGSFKTNFKYRDDFNELEFITEPLTADRMDAAG